MTKEKKITLEYVGILNETQQLFVFSTIFNKESYGAHIILNTALPAQIQDLQIAKTIKLLLEMGRKDAKKAKKVML